MVHMQVVLPGRVTNNGCLLAERLHAAFWQQSNLLMMVKSALNAYADALLRCC